MIKKTISVKSIRGSHRFPLIFESKKYAIIETQAFDKKFYSLAQKVTDRYTKRSKWVKYRGANNSRTPESLKRLKNWIDKQT